ncbi:hypothetical protein Peur_000906 [Populus x canadensis]
MEQHEFEMLWGYLLEFKGKNAFVQLWSESLIFLAANQYVCIGHLAGGGRAGGWHRCSERLHAAVLVVAPLLEQADEGCLSRSYCWCYVVAGVEELPAWRGWTLPLAFTLLSSWNRRRRNAGTGGPRWRMKFTMTARSQLAMEDEIIEWFLPPIEIVTAETGGLLLDWLVVRWKEEFTVESANMCCPWLKQEL